MAAQLTKCSPWKHDYLNSSLRTHVRNTGLVHLILAQSGVGWGWRQMGVSQPSLLSSSQASERPCYKNQKEQVLRNNRQSCLLAFICTCTHVYFTMHTSFTHAHTCISYMCTHVLHTCTHLYFTQAHTR